MLYNDVSLDSQILCYDNHAKNDTFKFFYAKFYELLSVDCRTNRHNEIIFVDIIINNYGNLAED